MILIVNHILIDNKMGEEVRHSQQKKIKYVYRRREFIMCDERQQKCLIDKMELHKKYCDKNGIFYIKFSYHMVEHQVSVTTHFPSILAFSLTFHLKFFTNYVFTSDNSQQAFKFNKN